MAATRPRHLLCALLCGAALPILMLPRGASAQVVPAPTQFPVASPAMQLAQGIARQYWHADPCGGQVRIAWGADVPSINARSAWFNPVSAYGDPARNSLCSITLNGTLTFTWAKLCTIVVHEYGHLTGHEHTVDSADVMSPVYRAPLPACVQADPTARRTGREPR